MRNIVLMNGTRKRKMHRLLEICKKCKKMKCDGDNACCEIFEFDFGYVERGHKEWIQKQDWKKEGMSNIADWEKLAVPDKVAKFKKVCPHIEEYDKIFHPPMRVERINEDELDMSAVADMSCWRKAKNPKTKKKRNETEIRDIEICKKCEVHAYGSKFKRDIVKSTKDDFSYETCYCPLESNSFDADLFESMEPPDGCPHYIEHVASGMKKSDKESLLAFDEENMQRDINLCKKCISFFHPYKDNGHWQYCCYLEGKQTGIYRSPVKEFKQRCIPNHCLKEGRYKVEAWKKSRKGETDKKP